MAGGCDTSKEEATAPERVYWFGRHPLRPEWKNPLGRVHSPKGACGPLLDARGTLTALQFKMLQLARNPNPTDTARRGAAGNGAAAAQGAAGGDARAPDPLDMVEVAPPPVVVPALTWCDRHSARGYEGAAGAAVLLRQLPTHWLDQLDDKRLMHKLMQTPIPRRRGVANGGSGIKPCGDRFDDGGAESKSGSDDGLAAAVPETLLAEEFLARYDGGRADATGVWFTKHARGIKGHQVDRHTTAAAACSFLQGLLPSSNGLDYRRHPNDRPALTDYVVQREVPPVLLDDGRRFCIRQHVLLVVPPFDPSKRGAAAAGPVAAPRGYSHRDVVVLPHSEPDTSAAGDADTGKAAHVQQAGTGHPTPRLLFNADPDRPAELKRLRRRVSGVDGDAVTAGLERIARAVLQQLCYYVASEHAAATAESHGWYYNLFGFDVVLDRCAGTAGGAGGPRVGTGPEPALLEVNVFPAIAAGTMAAVPRDIYARLVDDTLRLLAPILDAPAEPAPPPLGGFADVHLVAAD